MDRAILYDMKENSYLMKYQISESQAERMADSSGEILTILLTGFANTAMPLASFLFDDYIIRFVVFIFKKNRLKSILTIPETEIRCNGIPRYHIVGPGVSSMTTETEINSIEVSAID